MPLSLLIIVAIAFALFALNLYRVLNVSLTHDEAATFWDYITNSYINIFRCNPPSANNHILNTLSAKFFSHLFNAHSLVAFRFGSLVAYAIYLIYSAMLSLRLTQNAIASIAFFLLLNLNVYQFDFFALMRGYALSWAFMLMSVYYMVVYLEYGKQKALILLLISSILAVYANLVTLHFFMAVIAVLLMYAILNKEKRLPIIIYTILACACLYFLMASFIAVLKKYNQFYYGGDEGLLNDTMLSVVKRTFSINFDSTALPIVYFSILVIVAIGFYWGIRLIKYKEAQSKLAIALWLLPVVVLLTVQLQHLVLDSKFILGRTAIFIYPLWVIPVAYTLANIQVKKQTGVAILAVCTLAMLFNFSSNFRLQKTFDWEYNAYDLAIMDRMKKASIQKGRKITIRPFWLFAPSMNYYAATYYAKWCEPVVRDMAYWTNDTSYDFCYISRNDIRAISPIYKPDTTIIMESGEYILMRK